MLKKSAARLPRQKDWPAALAQQLGILGLPEPVREYRFHPTRKWRIDLAWPELMVAVEVDGAVHRIKGKWQRDREKLNALNLAGWTVLSVEPRDVRTGAALEIVEKMFKWRLPEN